MDFGSRDPRSRRPCESDSWPFCADPVLFEARRSVGQAVRTMLDFLPGDAFESGVLKYIFAADAIERVLRESVLPDLVAEARELGVGWDDIGKALDISNDAVQERFGSNGTPGRGDLGPMEDQVVSLTSQFMTGPHDSPDLDAIRETLGAATLQERMIYSDNLMQGALEAYRSAEAEIALPAEGRDERFVRKLYAAHQNIMTLTSVFIADPDQWAAVPGWGVQSKGPDNSHYHSPVTYLFYSMRLVMLACNYHMKALGSDLEFDERIPDFRKAYEILEGASIVMRRRDVRAMIGALGKEA